MAIRQHFATSIKFCCQKHCLYANLIKLPPKYQTILVNLKNNYLNLFIFGNEFVAIDNLLPKVKKIGDKVQVIAKVSGPKF